MKKRRAKVTNTIIQAVFMGIMGLLMVLAAWMLWSVATPPAYVGALGLGTAGLAAIWFLAVRPVLALNAPAPVKLPKNVIEARFDEDQLTTWILAIFGGVFILVTAVLAAAWLSGYGPKNTTPLKTFGLFGVLVAVDALGVWGWFRVVRSMRNKRTFTGLQMQLAAKPAIDREVQFSIGPLMPRVQRLLDQSALTLHLECWADLEFTTLQSVKSARGRARTRPEPNSAMERVATLDVPLSSGVQQDGVRITSSATPLSPNVLRAGATLQSRYVLAQKHYRDYEEFCERWEWMIRLRAGSRSCFFPLGIEHIVAGKPIPSDATGSEDE